VHAGDTLPQCAAGQKETASTAIYMAWWRIFIGVGRQGTLFRLSIWLLWWPCASMPCSLLSFLEHGKNNYFRRLPTLLPTIPHRLPLAAYTLPATCRYSGVTDWWHLKAWREYGIRRRRTTCKRDV